MDNNKRFYKISGEDMLYFVYTDLPLKDVQLYADIQIAKTAYLSITPRSAHAEECEPREVFGIRYGSQPIYGVMRSNIIGVTFSDYVEDRRNLKMIYA